ncbi:MAG: hypothetical protein EPO40_02735 [Myxococcaceae bacterium]|nr:MAG: hypothetical protein EPO40_02735 [Myxococcaceae bacterium]
MDAPAADVAELPDASAFDAPVVDAPPARLPACTNTLGPGLSRAYGRLDGRLVAIVPLQTRDCNGDPDHVHLQIAANGAVYDVAVNLGHRPVAGVPELAVASDDLPLPGGPWVEGWHPTIAPLDYVATLHLHAADFTPLAPAGVAARLDSELRDVGRIAVFATGYGPDGAHNVHRNGGHDGALALSPEGARARLLLFRFATQSF